MKIGVKLKEARIQRKWTQDYVASQLQVSRSTISSWEVGRTYPDLESLVRLSDLFEISLDTLLREDNTMTKDLSKNIRKGRNLKWIIALVLIICIPISFLAGQRYKEQKITYMSPNIVTAASIPDELTNTEQIELSFDVPQGLKYQGYTEAIENDTLYISLLANFEKGNKKQSENIEINLS
ncbi:helix-turn-helix transcriptional regulator [Enterococcus sp. MJM12]|nr:helix-turn-helix transcriptional regulator [Enterococcus sp. MJM12]MBO0449045.1 helix-turn-helix transcriptional regulator [Enterococcus sp. MJM12]